MSDKTHGVLQGVAHGSDLRVAYKDEGHEGSLPALTALTASTPDDRQPEPAMGAGDKTTATVKQFSRQQPPFVWEKDKPPGPQTRALCERIASLGELFTMPRGGIHWIRQGHLPERIDRAVKLEGFIRSHFEVEVFKGGDCVGYAVPQGDLNVLLATSALQVNLPVVDNITSVPTYDSMWQLTHPGYNSGAPGDRIFFMGETVTPNRKQTRILEFLGAMRFKSKADIANSVALALTILLRHKWPGSKPFGAVTANKSHAGKDTILDFAAGRTGRAEISYHSSDWATQNEAVAALKSREVGLISLGNVRAQAGVISSAFIERAITSPELLLQSSKMSGEGYSRPGDFIIAVTANKARFSVDLINRSLPIELEAIGNVNSRSSSIGDPRNEYLPAHREEIEAELCGMVENWKSAGSPLDTDARHPQREWAATIGGILKVNGFEDFLANWSLQGAAYDPIREALAIIAFAVVPNTWHRVSHLAKIATQEGVLGRLMDRSHRESDRSIARQLGVLLSAHRDETIHTEIGDEPFVLTLRKARKTTDGQVATVYCFEPHNGHGDSMNDTTPSGDTSPS